MNKNSTLKRSRKPTFYDNKNPRFFTIKAQNCTFYRNNKDCVYLTFIFFIFLGKTIDKKGDKLYHKGKTVKRSEKPVPSIKSPSSPES